MLIDWSREFWMCCHTVGITHDIWNIKRTLSIGSCLWYNVLHLCHGLLPCRPSLSSILISSTLSGCAHSGCSASPGSFTPRGPRMRCTWTLGRTARPGYRTTTVWRRYEESRSLYASVTGKVRPCAAANGCDMSQSPNNLSALYKLIWYRIFVA